MATKKVFAGYSSRSNKFLALSTQSGGSSRNPTSRNELETAQKLGINIMPLTKLKAKLNLSGPDQGNVSTLSKLKIGRTKGASTNGIAGRGC